MRRYLDTVKIRPLLIAFKSFLFGQRTKKNGSRVDGLNTRGGGGLIFGVLLYASKWRDGHLDKNDCNININKVAKYIEITKHCKNCFFPKMACAYYLHIYLFARVATKGFDLNINYMVFCIVI